MGTGLEIPPVPGSFFIGQQVIEFVCIETPSTSSAAVPTVFYF